jgi:hypothetical protein
MVMAVATLVQAPLLVITAGVLALVVDATVNALW